MLKNKVALSPVVATSLLLVVAVTSVVFFQSWFVSFSSNVFTDVEEDSQNSNSNLGVQALIGETLYFNAGSNTSISSINVNGRDCSISDSLSGVSEIDLSSCVERTEDIANIVVVTDKGVYDSYEFQDNSVSGVGGSSFTAPNFVFINYSDYSIQGINNVYSSYVFNGNLYLNAWNSAVGAELFEFDGTSFNVVEDYVAGVGNFQTSYLFPSGSNLFFTGDFDALTGREVYSYDGSTISLVHDLSPGTSDSYPGNYVEYLGDVYFGARPTNSHFDLYKLNDSGVFLASDLPDKTSGGGTTSFSFPVVYNNVLYFYSSNETTRMLYAFNGTESYPIVDSGGDYISGVTSITNYGGNLYISGTNPADDVGIEMYKFNGNDITLVSDIYSGLNSGTPNYVGVANNLLYFMATNGSGSKLYSYDGSSLEMVYEHSDFFDVLNSIYYFGGDVFFETGAGSYNSSTGQIEGYFQYNVIDSNGNVILDIYNTSVKRSEFFYNGIFYLYPLNLG